MDDEFQNEAWNTEFQLSRTYYHVILFYALVKKYLI